MVSDVFEPLGRLEKGPEAHQAGGKQEEEDGGIAHGVPGLRNAPDEADARTCTDGRKAYWVRVPNHSADQPTGHHPTEMEGSVARMEGSETELLHLRVQGRQADPQQFGSKGLVAAGVAEHAADMLPLDLLQFVHGAHLLFRFAHDLHG
jgi:hypothetical protein